MTAAISVILLEIMSNTNQLKALKTKQMLQMASAQIFLLSLVLFFLMYNISVSNYNIYIYILYIVCNYVLGQELSLTSSRHLAPKAKEDLVTKNRLITSSMVIDPLFLMCILLKIFKRKCREDIHVP